MTVANYIKQLLSIEEYSFSLDELIENLDKSEISIKSELSRLKSKNEIINIRKSFYIIITPRYSSVKKLPIQLYCEKLFRYLNRNYYLALFTAAKIHGASHQQIQKDYIITEIPKYNDIQKKTIDIRFFTTSNWASKNIQLKRADAGIYKISTPALTIVDLINHQTKLGGINRIISVIEELLEELEKTDLVELLSWYKQKSTLQRFGYLLEELQVDEVFQDLVFKKLQKTNFFPVLLSPKSNEKPGSSNNKWKVDVNVKLESDV